MHVLFVAAVGIAFVLTAILWWKLHPFLALLCGSMLIMLLTPESVFMESELKSKLIPLLELDSETGELVLGRRDASPGPYHIWKEGARELSERKLMLAAPNPGSPLYIADGDVESLQLRDQLIEVKDVLAARRSRISGVAKRIARGLADTFEKIGLPIAMAAIIGICLLESGAALRLVEFLTQCLGKQRTAPALSVSGFLLGVPIFFETVFYLLLPLAKVLATKQTGTYLLAVMAIIVGATMAHSLVPPTPGPLFVANELQVPIGTMMIGGFIVGGIAAMVGFFYGKWCNQRIVLEPAVTVHAVNPESTSVQSIKPMPLWMAIVPFALPILCLGGIEVWKAATPNAGGGTWSELLSDSGFVLLVTAITSIMILRTRVTTRQSATLLSRAVTDAGAILMLVCAGGGFGAALKQLRIADVIGEQFPAAVTPFGLLVAAFVLTAIIRAAQGSATVAMITSVGIMGPLVDATSLPYHTVYVALAIGCGSKPLPWMNDSGFWQISTMSGMTVQQTLRTFTVALTLMGFVGFGVTLLGAWLLPLR
jgi:GntP family gluconate:H+ symporter